MRPPELQREISEQRERNWQRGESYAKGKGIIERGQSEAGFGESESADRFRCHRHRGPERNRKGLRDAKGGDVKKGIGYAAASGVSVENYGEKKIVGYTGDGESVGTRVQSGDVKKALCSVHKMNLGGSVVVLNGRKSYAQNKENGQKTRINHEEGPRVMYLWLP